MSTINTDQPVWLQIVDAVRTYPYGCGRLTIADRFSISKSTAGEHLEKAVKRGYLRKFYGWIDKNYRGWIYIDPVDSPNAFRSDAEGFNQQPADLIRDDRFRQLDNLQDALDHLDELAELDDDELAWHIQTELELGHELPPGLN